MPYESAFSSCGASAPPGRFDCRSEDRLFAGEEYCSTHLPPSMAPESRAARERGSWSDPDRIPATSGSPLKDTAAGRWFPTSRWLNRELTGSFSTASEAMLVL